MNKFLSILLTVLLLGGFSSLCYAEEETPDLEEYINKQMIDIENAGGIIIFQKQADTKRHLQITRIRKSGGITIIQYDSKIKPLEDREDK